MTTDTSERGLERLICNRLTGSPCDAVLRRQVWKAKSPPLRRGRLDLRRPPKTTTASTR